MSVAVRCPECGHSGNVPESTVRVTCSKCVTRFPTQGNLAPPPAATPPSNSTAIVYCRCARSRRQFAIRFEQKDKGKWLATWAFSVDKSSEKHATADQNVITGDFDLDSSFPGCPHCHAKSAFGCMCGKLGCWDGEARTVTCPWCSVTGRLDGKVEGLSTQTDA
jgi:hypothetical protein